MDEQLTPNFKLSEFLIGETHVEGPILENLHRLAQALQKIRDEIKKPMRITSGYRSASHNAKVKGAPHSYHTRGMAADIVVVGMSPREFQKHMKDWPGGMGSYQGFTHLDIRPKKARWNNGSQ